MIAIDYGKNRRFKEVIGFYLLHVFLILLFGAFLSGLVALLAGKGNDFILGRRIGEGIAAFFSASIAIFILYKKQLIKPAHVLFAVLSGIVAYVGGILVGFLIPSYFAMMNKVEQNNHVFGRTV